MIRRTDKAAIGVAIAFCGMVACVALAALFHWLEPYMPAIREFILWSLDPRLAMGMGFGVIVGGAIMWCLSCDDRRPVEDLL